MDKKEHLNESMVVTKSYLCDLISGLTAAQGSNGSPTDWFRNAHESMQYLHERYYAQKELEYVVKASQAVMMKRGNQPSDLDDSRLRYHEDIRDCLAESIIRAYDAIKKKSAITGIRKAFRLGLDAMVVYGCSQLMDDPNLVNEYGKAFSDALGQPGIVENALKSAELYKESIASAAGFLRNYVMPFEIMRNLYIAIFSQSIRMKARLVAKPIRDAQRS